MAASNTWNALASNVQFGNDKTMFGLLNGGARYIRIRRVGVTHHNTTVTGVIAELWFRRWTATTTYTGSTSVTPTPHHSGNSALDTVTIGYAGTLGGGSATDTFRHWCWCTDEPTINIATIDELQCIIPLTVVFDCGYIDSRAQPIVLVEDQAIEVFNDTNTTAGYLDTWVEFTDEAS